MLSFVKNKEENFPKPASAIPSKLQGRSTSFSLFRDNRPMAAQQRQLQQIAVHSPKAIKAAQFQAMADIQSVSGLPIQRALYPWKQPLGGPVNANQVNVVADANTLDALTTAAYNNTKGRLDDSVNAAPPIPLNPAQFPGVRINMLANLVNAMHGNNDNLKAAAAGYVIEDQVTYNAAKPANAAFQQPRGNAILDFIITHGVERGVVDITSSGQTGHVRDKDYNEGPYAYIWESIYPSLDFNNLGAAPAVGGALMAAVQAAIRRRANSYIGSRLNNLKNNLWLYHTGIMQGNGAFFAAAQQAVNTINALPSPPNPAWTPMQVANADGDIAAANALLPPWAAQENITNMIANAQAKYVLAGNPPW